MHTLTVQDVLWIHLQTAKRTVPFNFAKLEEAVNYQFSYGKRRDVVKQAKRMAKGIVALAPFQEGNNEAALVALVAVLEANGYHCAVSSKNAPAWLEGVLSSNLDDVLEGVVKSDNHHELSVRDAAKAAVAKYA
ncbi:MAG TPA: hypothetical protein VK171_17015 [Fimbriimonas sp.]|nr:hypothetical protein [Fimbriimonas sp.]